MRSWVQPNANYLSAARTELRQSLRLPTREAFALVEGDFTASDYERLGKTIQKSPKTLFLQGLQAVFDYNRRSTNMSEHTHLAEAVRFELTNGVSRRRFSRPVHSTTLPHFRSCFLTVGAILSENGYELSHMCCV